MQDFGSAARARRAVPGLAVLLGLASAIAPRPAANAEPLPSSVDKRYQLVDTLAAPAPDSSRAVLWLLREQFARKNALPPERLYLDGKPLTLLPQRSYFVTTLAPGTHALTGLVGAPTMRFEFLAGHAYLLRLRELVDEFDVLRSRWLFDQPSSAASLIAASELPAVRLTPKGEADLAKKATNPWALGTALAARAVADSGFTQILFEHPLDPLNLKREFSVYSGELELLQDGLRYYLQKRRSDVTVEIPYARITDLRYGGTRFAGTSPWIDVVYDSDEGPLRASFAPATTDEPEAVYNRLFTQLTERWRAARPSAEPGAAAR